MSKPSKVEVPAGTFGFSFRMRANGTGGTFPKTYAINDIANNLLLGQVSEFVDTGNDPLAFGWASDPGDNVFPNGERDYGAVLADGLCPNNVRLSQVPLTSIVASHGIGPSQAQRNVPTSTNYNNGNFNNTPGGASTLGNFGGLKKVRLHLIDEAGGGGGEPVNSVLVNGGFLLSFTQFNYIEIPTSNLGSIAVVNLATHLVTIGVTAEMNL